jgi:hypothetical protein
LPNFTNKTNILDIYFSGFWIRGTPEPPMMLASIQISNTVNTENTVTKNNVVDDEYITKDSTKSDDEDDQTTTSDSYQTESYQLEDLFTNVRD